MAEILSNLVSLVTSFSLGKAEAKSGGYDEW